MGVKSIEEARAAKVALITILDAKHYDDVAVGLTQGENGYALKVNFAGDLDRQLAKLPSHIDGVEIIAEVVGKSAKREPDIGDDFAGLS